MSESKVVAPSIGETEEGSGVPNLTAEEIAALEAQNKGGEGGEGSDGNDGNDAEVISIDDTEYVLNEAGDALNEDGTVFKTKAEIEELNSGNDSDEATELEIDGVVYKLNENGDAIDEDGSVKYSKDDIDAMSEDTPAIKLDDIIKDTAIEIYDEQGNKVEYQNDEEGIKQYVSDVYNKAKNDGVNQVFEAYPVLNDLINHFQLGGTIDNFDSVPDYSSIELNKENEAQLKDIITQARTMRGDRPEAIERYYNALKAGDKNNDNVFEEASVELEFLNGVTKQEREAKEAAIANQQAAEIQEANKYWGVEVRDGQLVDLGVKDSIYNTIKQGTININDKSFTIPEKIKVIEDGKPNMYTRDDFFKYLYEPIIVNMNGNPIQITRHQLDVEKENANRTTGNDVYEAFKRFVKYDESQFIQEQVNKDKVKQIRKLTTRRNNNSSVSQHSKTTARVVAPRP
jgi:hypothetical protein